ncbi:MAG: 5'/3'-nucleotidase SurE [Leptospiraceae bacterium]|nr:5'/3'-nucleotidase SurE [Leptospiraceae bacterium]MCP5493532.1 5'/3'-nucleotidase SurE [Leptospiraceae bacterium]
MNLLISNDDGISSNGIKALEKVLSQKYKVFVIAPLKEKSATSQAMSITERLRVEKVYENHYIVDGFPVDCVNIGIFGNIFPKIDIVISGINRGVNMGHDVHYSGTVGAARHAAIHNKYAFAVSSGKIDRDSDYTREAEIILQLLQEKLSVFKKGVVYNINFPEEFSPTLDSIEITQLGIRTYYDTYTVTQLIDNIYEFYMGGSQLGHQFSPGSDFDAYYSKKIPLTPILLDTTDYKEIESLKNKF